MKKSSLLATLMLGAVLILNGTGCKHSNIGTTKIPGPLSSPGTDDPSRNGKNSNLNTQGITEGTPDTTFTAKPPGENNLDPLSPFADVLHNGKEDREKFASDTVYFDTDSSAIRKSEEGKLQTVADYFKNNTSKDALRLEGYCDERGTEQYNIALGDRRAQAVRDYLINLGVNGQRMENVSLGEANPVDSGHGEEHWKKNRRGVFVLMTPK